MSASQTRRLMDSSLGQAQGNPSAKRLAKRKKTPGETPGVASNCFWLQTGYPP
ncbi:MAG: hypothetical protein QF562_08785 [Verrucomicrobiota bacterium]|nr:hypothetical protein [Verrucomicrobiota bacterium]